MLTVPETESLLPALRRIAEMAELPANWDSYGGEPPSPRAIAGACLLIEAVAETRDRSGGGARAPWTSAPLPTGGLQVEWLGDQARIEVQIGPTGALGYLVSRNDDSEFDEADDAPFDDVVERIVNVLES